MLLLLYNYAYVYLQKKSQLIIKMDVSENLEREAKAPRVKNFKLPTPQVKYLTYLLNKYHDDYKVCTEHFRFIILKFLINGFLVCTVTLLVSNVQCQKYMYW